MTIDSFEDLHFKNRPRPVRLKIPNFSNGFWKRTSSCFLLSQTGRWSVQSLCYTWWTRVTGNHDKQVYRDSDSVFCRLIWVFQDEWRWIFLIHSIGVSVWCRSYRLSEGWVYDLEAIGTPSILRLIHSADSLTDFVDLRFELGVEHRVTVVKLLGLRKLKSWSRKKSVMSLQK